MTDQPSRLLIDPSVRVSDLAKAFESVGLVLVSSELGLKVMSRSQRELTQLRKAR